MKTKILILLLIPLSFTACKSNLCSNDRSYSTLLPSTAVDRRCRKIEQEEEAKNPGVCEKKPEYKNVMRTSSNAHEISVSWEKCEALSKRVYNKCKALPPAKPEDWIPLSGNIFVSNDKPVAQDGKPLPKCSECKSCTPAEPTTPPIPVQPQPQQAPVTPPQTTQPPTTTKSAPKTLPPLPIPPPEPPPQPTL